MTMVDLSGTVTSVSSFWVSMIGIELPLMVCEPPMLFVGLADAQGDLVVRVDDGDDAELQQHVLVGDGGGADEVGRTAGEARGGRGRHGHLAAGGDERGLVVRRIDARARDDLEAVGRFQRADVGVDRVADRAVDGQPAHERKTGGGGHGARFRHACGGQPGRRVDQAGGGAVAACLLKLLQDVDAELRCPR